MMLKKVNFGEISKKEKMSRKQRIKDKVILTVKNAIADNADIDIGTDTVTTDCNGVDHLAEQVAEEVYKMFEPVSIDEQGALGECGATANREQQIEELNNFILSHLYEGSTLLLAENLYNAGYRKVDEVKQLNSIIVVNKPIQEIKNEAVKEFAEKLKNLLYTVYGNYGAPLGDLTAEDVACEIDELLKEYENDESRSNRSF